MCVRVINSTLNVVYCQFADSEVTVRWTLLQLLTSSTACRTHWLTVLVFLTPAAAAAAAITAESCAGCLLLINILTILPVRLTLQDFITKY